MSHRFNIPGFHKYAAGVVLVLMAVVFGGDLRGG